MGHSALVSAYEVDGGTFSRISFPFRHPLFVLLVCAGYYAGALIGQSLRFPNSHLSLIWPPTAILLAALLLAIVAVRDRGVGLRGDQLEKIFQPFYTTKDNGLGMGLAISRSIVEAHGGRLWAQNNSDRGATIYFMVLLAESGN